jgi:hypothetical protein
VQGGKCQICQTAHSQNRSHTSRGWNGMKWPFPYKMFWRLRFNMFRPTRTLLHTYNHHHHHGSWIMDHGSHIHLHIESPPTWHFKNTQPFRNSGAEQRQGCTEHVSTLNMIYVGFKQLKPGKTFWWCNMAMDKKRISYLGNSSKFNLKFIQLIRWRYPMEYPLWYSDFAWLGEMGNWPAEKETRSVIEKRPFEVFLFFLRL